MAGQVMMVQMHVDLDPELTLDAAHAIVVEAENRILSHYPTADILIHADPRGRPRPQPAETAGASPPSDAAPEAKTDTQTPLQPRPKGPWS
jgi:hypothetical protein